MRLNDPDVVACQYATETKLEARRSLYADTEGPDPREVTFAAVAECAPRRILEVGGGPGELAARMQAELGAEVVMIDVSPRMVELARGRDVDARVADAQDLGFDDGEFDCAVAAWMLFHLADVDGGVAELARVLRDGGRLVATTNAAHHLQELRALVGASPWSLVFSRENGEQVLRRHFRRVERRDVEGSLTIHHRATVEAYVESLDRDEPTVIPPFELPLRARRASSVFVATK
jgi:SAM-dependent methyltransferase